MAHAVTVDAELRADGVGSSTNAVFVFFEKVAVAGLKLGQDGTMMVGKRSLSVRVYKTRVKMAKR